MKRLLLLTTIFLNSINAYAEAFLCIEEAIAGVVQGEAIETKATIYKAEAKFILNRVEEKWVFKKFGSKEPAWPCSSAFYCSQSLELNTAVATNIFFRKDNNEFTVTSNIFKDPEGKNTEYVVRRGSCESI